MVIGVGLSIDYIRLIFNLFFFFLKSKGKLLDFYKERAQQFYDGHVEEINFKGIVETLRRQTNHLVKRQTWGKITDFLRGANLALRPPLAAFSANIFQVSVESFFFFDGADI